MASYSTDPKLFMGLKNDEDAKQITTEYFSDMRNFGYPEVGILGINKILMPEEVAIFLSPDIEKQLSDTITLTGDNITTLTHTGDYLWNAGDTLWDLTEWS